MPLHLRLSKGFLGKAQVSTVTITQVNPTTLTGPVGTPVLLQGTILTLNGTYQILFDQTIVSIGNSNAYSVVANLNVPEIANGTHALTLRDLTANQNATDEFTVTTAYTITAVPAMIQEGGTVTLNLKVTGGLPNTVYNANISVALPSPLGTEYSKIVPLGTSNQEGTATAQVTYPDVSFQPAVPLQITQAHTLFI